MFALSLPTFGYLLLSAVSVVFATNPWVGVRAVALSASALKELKPANMQEIEKLPRRDQEALLRTIEAFISKTS